MATDMRVSRTILQQLGGNKFIAMTGAKSFVGSNDSLMFSIGGGANKGINKVRITLTALDLYTIEFMKMRKLECLLIDTTNGVYADQLTAVFESVTGFKTKL